MSSKASLAIGLVVPVVGVLGGLLVVADTTASVLGVPLLFAWLFLWFPLTSVCLWIAWAIDRHDHPDDER